MIHKSTLFLLFLSLLSSCASSYKATRPDMLSYMNRAISDSIAFSYQYDVMKIRNNRKYQRREDRRDIRILAVKFENLSNSEINLNKINFYAGQGKIALMDPLLIHKKVKQKVLIYLLYSFANITRTETNCIGKNCVTTTHLVFPLGPFIAIGNMIVAGIANSNFKKELEYYRMKDYSLKPGEKYFAIIGFQSISHEPLTIKIKNDNIEN